MAVTITTKFYETTWHDLSKVVFTSPNMDTGITAGTRSHVLPGELNLATWYEDISLMYRIFNEQVDSNGVEYVNNLYGTTVSGFHIQNSIKFELVGPTGGESYNNRLTAWDDVTHSSTTNYLINSDRVKVSAVAYRYTIGTGSEDNPETVVEVHAPSYNISLKGDTTISGVDYYYGDFDMIYANPTTGHVGDVLIFRPMLDNITNVVPYGVHDFVITLHYSYT
jgi:hypothetical protein